jgi:hypothetical protein
MAQNRMSLLSRHTRNTLGVSPFGYQMEQRSQGWLRPLRSDRGVSKGAKMKKVAVIIIGMAAYFLFPLASNGQSHNTTDPCLVTVKQDPYACFEHARALVRSQRSSRLSETIIELVKQNHNEPFYYLEIAELMKGSGNPRAEYYYKKALESDPREPAFDLFFADYLRNYRGPLKPLYPRAEAHYFEALEKLARLNAANKPSWHGETARRAERGLIALYQEDGIPVKVRNHLEDWIRYPERPLLFISSINQWAQSTGDFDNADDIRAFTSEMLLAEQRRVENRLAALTEDDLRSIARTKPQYETLERLRIRYKNLPMFEISYRNRQVERGAITQFQFTDHTNDVRIQSDYGAAVEKPFSLSAGFDFFLRGSYNRIDRTGLIESAPAAHEIINQYQGIFAASRFVGPDKAIFQSVYLYQDINPQLDKAQITKRDRQIASTKFTYTLLRKFRSHEFGAQDPDSKGLGRRSETLFELRGWSFFGGVAYDNERFGLVTLRKKDYFSGSEIKGLKSGRLDLGYQATIFTAEVRGNTLPTDLPFAVSDRLAGSNVEPGDLVRRQNTQLRHNANVLIRLKDEEREPGLPADGVGWLHPAFFHLVFPFKYDRALDRHKEFENYRLGCELSAKAFSVPFRGTSFLVTGGYSRQKFFNLGKSVNLANVSFSVGF